MLFGELGHRFHRGLRIAEGQGQTIESQTSAIFGPDEPGDLPERLVNVLLAVGQSLLFSALDRIVIEPD